MGRVARCPDQRGQRPDRRCRRFGTTYGFVFTGWGVAGLLAPVAAASLAATVGYGAVYRIFIVVAVLSRACVAMYARLVRDRRES